jgi:hypothetical protein
VLKFKLSRDSAIESASLITFVFHLFQF